MAASLGRLSPLKPFSAATCFLALFSHLLLGHMNRAKLQHRIKPVDTDRRMAINGLRVSGGAIGGPNYGSKRGQYRR
jgi:hypothetical protein